MISFPDHGLYAITDGPRDHMEGNVADVLRGGARALQYRDGTRDLTRRLHEARVLRKLCLQHGVPFLVEADIELARAVGADGVHLGEPDGIVAARAELGEHAIVGVACRDSLDRARAAAAAGASYISFGAFFPSPTLPGAGRASVELLRQSAELGLPRVAIGGITPDNGAALIEAGADCLAAISAVFGAADPGAQAQRFARLFLSKRDRP